MRVDELLKAIQSKYVGTADEHGLLCELIGDYSKMYDTMKELYASQFEDQQRQLDIEQAEASKLSDGARIDAAVFFWFSVRGSPDAEVYEVNCVIDAMKGRGMKYNDLLAICEAWATDAVNEAEATDANQD